MCTKCPPISSTTQLIVSVSFGFRLSGFQLPSSIVSSGSILTLWFTTDFAVSAQGFKALYEGRRQPLCSPPPIYHRWGNEQKFCWFYSAGLFWVLRVGGCSSSKAYLHNLLSKQEHSWDWKKFGVSRHLVEKHFGIWKYVSVFENAEHPFSVQSIFLSLLLNDKVGPPCCSEQDCVVRLKSSNKQRLL